MTEIFVFGSNLAGRHGAGAARHAREHFGAQWGVGVGIQGAAYAIPTKDGRGAADLREPSQTLPLDAIRKHVDDFRTYAIAHPDLTFKVTPIGCGLAGYTPAQIAPMFAGCPGNVVLPPEFTDAIRTA